MKHILHIGATWLLTALLAMTATTALSSDYIYTYTEKLKITGEELLANGNFSNGFDQWQVDTDAWTLIPNGAPYGANAAMAQAGGQLTYTCALEAGTYALSFQAKCPLDHVIAANIDIYYSNSSDGSDNVGDVVTQVAMAPDWTTHNIKLETTQPLHLVVSLKNQTAGVMLAGFSLKSATEVYDSRQLERFYEYAQAVATSGRFTQDTNGFATKLQTLKRVLEGIATGERKDHELGADIDLDRMEDGANTLQQMTNDFYTYLDQNSGDLLAMQPSWTSYGKMTKFNYIGKWYSPVARWNHDAYDNAIRYEYPFGYELESTCTNYQVVAPYTGTYMFKADVKGLYYCASYVSDPITPFHNAMVYGGPVPPYNLQSINEIDLITSARCNNMEQTQYHSTIVFVEAEAGQELNFGVYYLNDGTQQGRQLGGNFYIANPELRLLGYSTEQVNAEFMRADIVKWQTDLLNLLEETNRWVSMTKADGYPWRAAQLAAARETAQQTYNESLAAVDAQGQVVDAEKVNDNTIELLETAYRELRRTYNSFISTNRSFQELQQTIAGSKELYVNEAYAADSRERLKQATEQAEAVVNSVVESSDESVVSEARENVVNANSQLKLAIDNFYMDAATKDSPYEVALTNPDFNQDTDSGNATSVEGWEYTCNNSDRSKEAFKRVEDSHFEGGYRRGVWRGSSVAPASKLAQTVTLRRAGIYEYRAQGYAASENRSHDQAMWQIIYDEQGQPTDTIFNGNSRVKLFLKQKYGEQGASAAVKSHYYGFPLAEGREANLYIPTWYSVFYVKETDDEEVVELGMDSFGQLEIEPNGANAYGFGSNALYYYGQQVQDVRNEVADRLNAGIAEALALWPDCSPSQALLRLGKAIKHAKQALSEGSVQDQANALWTLTEAVLDAQALAQPAPTEGHRTWDFTQWNQFTKDDLLEEARTVAAPLESDKATHHSWRAFGKYNATNNMEDANYRYFWGDNTVGDNGQLVVAGHDIRETRGLKFKVKAGSLSIVVRDEKQCLYMGSKNTMLIIPNVKPGWYVSVDVSSHVDSEARGVDASIEGFEGMTLQFKQGSNRVLNRTTCVWQVPDNISVPEEGANIILTNNNGCHIYYIKVSEDYYPPTEGRDMTPLIANASYTQGTYGWSTEGGQDWLSGSYNLRVDWDTCEGWNVNYFDIHQQLRQMPEGIYKMDVQGFYRYKGRDDAYYAYMEAQEKGTEIDVPVSFYINGMGRPLKNYFTEPVDSGTVYDWNNMYVYWTPDNKHWFPNSMKSSSVAFNAGMYQNSGYGYVSAKDGVLQLGVKGSTSQDNNSWAIWDNFRLTYEGKRPDASKNAALQLAEEIVPLLENPCNGELKQFMIAHIEAARQLEPIEGNRDALYNNFVEMLGKRDALVASVSLYAQLKTALDSLQSAINECKRIKPKAEAEWYHQHASNFLNGNNSDQEVNDAIANVFTYINYVKNVESLAYVDRPRRWDFTQWSQTTKDLLRQDAINVTAPLDSISPNHYSWRAFEKKYETDNLANIDKVYWWGWSEPIGRQLVNSQGQTFFETAGLYFNRCLPGSMAIAIDHPATEKGDYAGGQYLWMGGKKQSFYIPDVQPGSIISIGVESHSISEERGLDMTINGNYCQPIEGSSRVTTLTNCVWQVPDTTATALDVLLENSNGCHIYYIEVKMPNDILSEGLDMTSLILNPNFHQNTFGWSTEGGQDWSSDTGVNLKVDYGTCEAWKVDSFDIHQQLKQMPEGIYEVDAQGFYRYMRGDDAYNAYTEAKSSGKDIDIPVFLYLNDMKAPFGNVFAEPVEPGQLYTSGMKVYTTPDGQQCYPNDMYSASTAFSANMYQLHSYGLVPTDNGTLSLGVEGSTNQQSDSWAIWSNFRLIYHGKDPYASKAAIEQLAIQIQPLLGEHYDRNLKNTLGNQMATAQQMEPTEDNREALYQSFVSLLQAKRQLDASLVLFEQLRQVIDSLDLAIQTYTLNKTNTAQAKALLSQVRAGYEGGYTDEDARQALVLIAQTIATLRTNTPDEICQPVIFAQTGNTITLVSEADATIYYTTDGSTPTTQSTRYEQPFDIDQLCTIKSLATKEGKQASPVAAYEVEYFFAGDVLQLKSAGLLSKALAWQGSKEKKRLFIVGSISATDFPSLRTLTGLQQLDLSEATLAEGSLPEGAFAGMTSLVAFASPKEIANVGERLFNACSNLAAIQWKANRPLSEAAMKGVSNPNLLLYVNTKGFASSSVRNIIANGTAESIVLSDLYLGSNANFFCPEAFHADKISYSHRYEMTTEKQVPQGWETLALPFTVQSITHESKGTIAPFADTSANDETPRFWLYGMSVGSNFQRSANIEAYKPYIISMPNNTAYAQRYNLGGMVSFSASNIDVEATPNSDLTLQGATFALTPVFCGQEQNDLCFALNIKNSNTPYIGELRPGSTFMAGLRSLHPFEAYATQLGGNAREMLPLSELFEEDATGIESIETIQPTSSAIYDLGGRKVSEDDGQLQPLKKGVYVRQGRKIVISRNR